MPGELPDHGPLDDYEMAAGMADAIHGRIIVQEVELETTSPEERNQKGGNENGMETT